MSTFSKGLIAFIYLLRKEKPIDPSRAAHQVGSLSKKYELVTTGCDGYIPDSKWVVVQFCSWKDSVQPVLSSSPLRLYSCYNLELILAAPSCSGNTKPIAGSEKILPRSLAVVLSFCWLSPWSSAFDCIQSAVMLLCLALTKIWWPLRLLFALSFASTVRLSVCKISKDFK